MPLHLFLYRHSVFQWQYFGYALSTSDAFAVHIFLLCSSEVIFIEPQFFLGGGLQQLCLSSMLISADFTIQCNIVFLCSVIHFSIACRSYANKVSISVDQFFLLIIVACMLCTIPHSGNNSITDQVSKTELSH